MIIREVYKSHDVINVKTEFENLGDGLLRCTACGYTWLKRVKNPKQCPQCHRQKGWGIRR